MTRRAASQFYVWFWGKNVRRKTSVTRNGQAAQAASNRQFFTRPSLQKPVDLMSLHAQSQALGKATCPWFIYRLTYFAMPYKLRRRMARQIRRYAFKLRHCPPS
ncbi:MAG: hypothetical protein ACRD22_03745 [Terriglobia bacterium]